MKQTLFITGTDTGVGKTVLTALLARFLRGRGLMVAAFKPLCSGGRSDALALHTALSGSMSLDEINPWHFRAPIAPLLAARLERKSVPLARVVAHIRVTQKKSAVTLVEGAGGLLSPLGEDFDSLDLLFALHAQPVIVAANRLGAVNHVLLTLAVLPEKQRQQARVIFMTPQKPDAATAANAKLLGEFFPAKKIFTLPWLGKTFDPASVVRRPQMRRTLQELLA